MPTPNTETAPALAFDESSMREAFEKLNPDIAQIEPEGTPRPEKKEAAEPLLTPEETAEPVTTETPAETSINDEAAALLKSQEEEAAKKAAEEEAKKAAAAATESAPVHPDLEEKEKALDPHTKPKTRKVITEFKNIAIAERARATALEKEQATLKQQLAELDTQIKSGKPPKAVEEELTTLRERIRELDASRDPAIEAKYDKPIAANTEAAINMLGEYGLFKVAEVDKEGKPTGTFRDMTEKEKGQITSAIKAGGVGLRTMAQHIKRLEASGDVEGAEQLRDWARQNDALTKAKQAEVGSIKTDYEGRVQARTKEQQAQQEQMMNTVKAVSEKTLKADLAELSKIFPGVNPPPEPLPTDPAAVVASKKAAIAEFAAMGQAVSESVKAFNGSGLPPAQAAEAQGRMAASAVQAVILKNHVLPKLSKQLTEASARIKDLEAQVAKFRTAGGVNRAHIASINAGAGDKQQTQLPANASIGDALREAARAAGIDVNS